MKRWPLALLAAGLVVGTLQAATTGTWPIDGARSQASFSVRRLLFTHVRGTFPDLTGTVWRFAGPGGDVLVRVDATLDVAGLEMDDPALRAHALGPRFFDAARFPRARFVSDPFPVQRLASGGLLEGNLDLRGRHQPVTLSVAPSACPRQPLECVIQVRGTISRSRFGMRAWRGAVSDKVHLDLAIRLRDPS